MENGIVILYLNFLIYKIWTIIFYCIRWKENLNEIQKIFSTLPKLKMLVITNKCTIHWKLLLCLLCFYSLLILFPFSIFFPIYQLFLELTFFPPKGHLKYVFTNILNPSPLLSPHTSSSLITSNTKSLWKPWARRLYTKWTSKPVASLTSI